MSEESPKKLKCIWIALKYIKIYIVEKQFHLSALNWMSGRVYAKNKHKTEEKNINPWNRFDHAPNNSRCSCETELCIDLLSPGSPSQLNWNKR